LIDVQGVDFVRVPVTDIEQAKDFYGGVLGLPPGPTQHENWVEYQAGNLTLAVMTPETHDEEFVPLPPGIVGLRVPDSPLRRRSSRRRASRSGTSGTRESATALHSQIRPVTGSRSTTATHPATDAGRAGRFHQRPHA
jgi:catechol 2,3-dioxygenase-like lactoylglutathione lyase family enzyme